MEGLNIQSDDDILSIGSDDDDDLEEVKIVSRSKKPSKRKQKVKTVKKVKNEEHSHQIMNSHVRPRRQEFTDTTFEALGNPHKTRVVPPPVESEDELSSVMDEQSEGVPESFDGGFADEEDEEGVMVPSEGFSSIEEEKQDLLYKFHRLESKGFKMTKRFNAHSDIRDMRAEHLKIKKDAETNASVKFSRRALLAIVSGAEFLNKRYDPFTLELNGWSENVMENLNEGEYDNVFERLHEKYSGKVNAPPEMELMMSLAGSALMFHMTKSMFKGAPDMKEFTNKNPNFVQNLMNKMNKKKGGDEGTDEGDNDGMQGPSVNLGSMFGNNFPPHPVPGNNAPRREPSIISVSSSSDSSNGGDSPAHSHKVVSVAISEGGTRRPRKPTIKSTLENTINI